MEPHKKYHWCLHVVIRAYFKFTFQDFFQTVFRYTPGYFFVLAIYISAVFSCFYTYIYYDTATGLHSVSMASGYFVFALKQCLVKELNSVVKIAAFIGEIYNKTAGALETNDFWYFGICKKYATISERIVKVIVSMPLFVLLFLLLASGSQYMLSGIRESPLRIFIPGLDERTEAGFAILCVYHFVIQIFGYVTLCSFDMLLYVVVANISMVASIRNRRLAELEVALKNPKCHSAEIKARMLNIILMHLKYNQIIGELDKSFFIICFVQITAAIAGATMTLYVCLTENIVSEYNLVFITLLQIVAYCSLGTVIEISGNRVHVSIKTFDWYLLPKSEIKPYLMLLQHSQYPQILRIGGMKNLNMETCVSILSSIYSCTMILYRTL